MKMPDLQQDWAMLEKCLSCAQSMDGADGVLRCLVSTNALPCSEALAEDCGQYLYEPGTDAAEAQNK